MDVHYAETTPHAHAIIIPAVISRKTGRLTISSASMLTRAELKQFHPDLEAHMESVFGIKHMVLNGRTKQGLTPEQIKSQQAYEEVINNYEKSIQEREQNVASLETMLEMVERAINELEQLKKQRENESKDTTREQSQLDSLYDIKAKLKSGYKGSTQKLAGSGFTGNNNSNQFSY